MTLIILQVLAVVALTVVNGIFAASETALISSRQERLSDRADRMGDAGASAAIRLLSNPNRFLSTVQIGISLVGVTAGAVGGASLSAPLGDAISGAPLVGQYAGTISFVLVVGAITYLSLIIGELVPKRLALANPERFASFAARPMSFISRITAPVVWFLGVSTEAVLKLVPGRSDGEEPSVSEREVEIMLKSGHEQGVFEKEESDLARRALRLDDRPVREIMTPRNDVVWLNVEDSPDSHRRRVSDSGFSRFPVGQGSLDQLIGVLSTRTVFERALAGGGVDLLPSESDPQDYLLGPAFVSEGAAISSVVGAFRDAGCRMAVVVDERGNFEGIVTLHDVLQDLFGAFPTRSEEGGAANGSGNIVTRRDGSLLLDGLLSATELRERLGLKQLPNEDEGYQTAGGMALSVLRNFPSEGDIFEWEGWEFEIVDMDGYRVDKILATRQPEAPE